MYEEAEESSPGAQVEETLKRIWNFSNGQKRASDTIVTFMTTADRQTVQRWGAQADSVPEFLEMLHVEDLIGLGTIRCLSAEHCPLYRIWRKLRQFCQLAGDIGEFPAHRIIVGDAQAPIPDTAIRLSPVRVREAAEAWTHFEREGQPVLGSPGLGAVFSEAIRKLNF